MLTSGRNRRKAADVGMSETCVVPGRDSREMPLAARVVLLTSAWNEPKAADVSMGAKDEESMNDADVSMEWTKRMVVLRRSVNALADGRPILHMWRFGLQGQAAALRSACDSVLKH